MPPKYIRSHPKHSIPTAILNDLCSRFILYMPAEDRCNMLKLCLQMETAHWFFLDNYCNDNQNNVNKCKFKQFVEHVFEHLPELRKHKDDIDSILGNWRSYKMTIPTCGAILLDTELTHVLLVQAYWSKVSWGFPKGKINENEDPPICAIREVFEETGFDISTLINTNEYIEATIHDQHVRLYIIYNVSRYTQFMPRTRKEIRDIHWFPISDLPINKRDKTPKMRLDMNPNKFFMVMPFVKRIRRLVNDKLAKGYVTDTSRPQWADGMVPSLWVDGEPLTLMGKEKTQFFEKEFVDKNLNSNQKCVSANDTPATEIESKNYTSQLFAPQNLSEEEPKPIENDQEYMALLNCAWENLKFDTEK